MDAKKFFDQYILSVKENALYEDGREYLEIYKTDEPTFTKIINNRIVPEIIKNEGWTSQNEYFRIDTVGWETHYWDIEAESKKLGLSPHLWDLKIAVEHENNKSDWTDEVIKLAHIRCPLKVVIGYAHCDERTDIEKEKLQFVYSCLSKIKAFDPHANEELLIILGNGAPRHKTNEPYDFFNYKGYVLTKGKTKFEELE